MDWDVDFANFGFNFTDKFKPDGVEDKIIPTNSSPNENNCEFMSSNELRDSIRSFRKLIKQSLIHLRSLAPYDLFDDLKSTTGADDPFTVAFLLYTVLGPRKIAASHRLRV